MDKTLDIVLDDIKQFVSDHYIMKSVFDNPINDSNQSDVVYPLVYIRYSGGTVDDGYIDIGLELSFMDKLNSDQSNQRSIMSNMINLGLDTKTMFRDAHENRCWHILPASSYTPAEFTNLPDNSIGVSFNMTARVRYRANVKNIPMK